MVVEQDANRMLTAVPPLAIKTVQTLPVAPVRSERVKRGETNVPLMAHLILKSSAASLALSISSISRAFSRVLLLTWQRLAR